jgi:hypothetical protein
MMVPYALWTGFYALLSYSMYNNVNNHPINWTNQMRSFIHSTIHLILSPH